MRICMIAIICIVSNTVCMEKKQPDVFEIICSDGVANITRNEEIDQKIKLAVHLLLDQASYTQLLDDSDNLKSGSHRIDVSLLLSTQTVNQFEQSGNLTRLLKSNMKKKDRLKIS